MSLPEAPELLARAVEVGEFVAASAEEHAGGVRWPHYKGERDCWPHDLYSGQAGVALFLANLARVTGEERWADLACRAVELAWEAAGRQPRLNPAVICGDGGLPFALLTLNDAQAQDEAAGMWRAIREREECEPYDLFYGLAGAGMGYLSAWRRGCGDELLAAAKRCGERLEAGAIRGRHDVHWSCGPDDPTVYVGLSHGTAGIACFLFELGEATREERWLELAGGGARWVVSKGIRRFDGMVFPTSDPPEPKILTYWCHGAAGIAFAFLAAHRATGDLAWRAIALGCLSATDHFLAKHEVRHAGQCHGVAGLLEALVEGAVALGEAKWLDKAREHARRLLLPRAPDGRRYPAETPEPACELMVGRSGVGQVFLRLAAPERVAHHGLALR